MSDAPGRETTMAEATMGEAASIPTDAAAASVPTNAWDGDVAARSLLGARVGEVVPPEALQVAAPADARQTMPNDARPIMPTPDGAGQLVAMPDGAREVVAPVEARTGPATLADAQQVVALLALPQGPISLELLRLHIATRPACRVIGVVTAAGVPGLEADEMVLLVVSGGAGQWRGTVLCQRAGVAGYVVEGVSIIPEREPYTHASADQGSEPDAADAAPVWTYLDYRAVVWADADGARRYRVERRDPATEAWRPSDEWQTGLWPDTAGGVIDCLLWLKQKGRL